MVKEGTISLTPEERSQVEDLIPDIIEAISGGYIGDNRQLEIGEIDALSADKTPIKVKIFVGNNLSLKNADGYYQTNDPKNPTDNLILIQQFHYAPYFKGLSGLDLKLTKIATGNENIGLEKLRKVLKHELIHAKDPAENQHYSNRGYNSDNAEIYYKSWTEFQSMTGQFFEAITTGVDRALRLGMSKDDVLKALNNILQYYSGKTKIFNQEAKDFIQGSGKRNIFQSLINFFTNLKSAIEDYAGYLSMIKKYNPEGYKEFLTDLYKTVDQAKDKLKNLQEMQQINEEKRMQKLAGLITESQINEENIEEGFKEWVLAGLITLGTIAGGTKVYQMDKEAEVDRKAQTEYYENILSKSLEKMSDAEKTELGSTINRKTKALSIAPTSDITPIEFSRILLRYAEDYIKSHANEFSVDAQDGSLHWKFEQAATY